ncbi:hypothetical protein ACFWHL_16465 [Streptomyces massasporeus]
MGRRARIRDWGCSVNAETFNSLYRIGTLVFAYPGCRPEDFPKDTRLVTRTRSKAEVLGGHTDVVWVDGHSACIALTHVDPVSESVWQAAKEAEETAAAVAAEPTPVPVGDQPQPLDDTRLAEIRDRASKRAAALTAWLDKFSPFSEGQREVENAETVLEEDVPALVAEIERLRAERHTTNEALSDAAEALRANRDHLSQLEAELAKYVGAEPTIAEEMEYLSGCLNAVRDLCDATEKQATRWENPLPVPDWVEQVRTATDGLRPDDPNDNRRRIYIDGKGEAWLSLSHDRGIRYIGKLAGAFHGDDTTDTVRERTGSLREIGRCW